MAFILICLPSKWRQLLLLPLLMIIVLQLKWPTQYFLLSFGQQYLSPPFTSTLKPLSLVYSFTYVIGFLQVVKEVHWCKNRRVRPKPPTAKMARASGPQRQRGGWRVKNSAFFPMSCYLWPLKSTEITFLFVSLIWIITFVKKIGNFMKKKVFGKFRKNYWKLFFINWKLEGK